MEERLGKKCQGAARRGGEEGGRRGGEEEGSKLQSGNHCRYTQRNGQVCFFLLVDLDHLTLIDLLKTKVNEQNTEQRGEEKHIMRFFTQKVIRA